MIHKLETELGGRNFSIETGKVAKQANGAVWIQFGETVVLVTACRVCNRRKGGRTPKEAGMPLRSRPREPHASAEYLFGRVLEQHDEWEDYIRGW